MVVSTVLIGALSACNSGDKKSGGDAAAAGAPSGAASTAASAPAAGGKKDLDPKAALAAAAAVMEKAGNAKLVMSGSTPDDNGTGLFSWKSPQALELSVKEEGKETKVLFAGDVMYVGVDAEMGAMFPGKKWLKLDPKAGAAAPGMEDLNAFGSMLQLLNPAVELAANAQAGKLAKVGPEKVDGVDTVHYKSTIAAKDLVAAMTGLSDALKASVLKELTSTGAESTMDFWINEKAELVQMGGTDLNPGKGAASAASTAGTTTLKYTELGKATVPAAPPAAEVADMSELLKSLGTS
ncbi:hypothetical protein AB0K43_03790 [Kitasatospora sp. NPDC049258]|uniref:hypothetical protein n=1 Tax=Kitasatospora sp. NPDC049258 TaxID=3155394 RepID=UPI00343CD6FC